MRWFIAALVTLALGAVNASQPSADTAPVDDPTLIVDVRTAEEFAAGHFPGAINIPHEEIIQGIHEYNVGKDQTVCSIAAAVTARAGRSSPAVSRFFRGKKCWRPQCAAGRHRQSGSPTQPLSRTTASASETEERSVFWRPCAVRSTALSRRVSPSLKIAPALRRVIDPDPGCTALRRRCRTARSAGLPHHSHA